MEQIDNNIRNRQIKGTDTNQVRVDKDGTTIPPTNRGIDRNQVRVDKAGYVIPPTNRGIDSNRVKVDKAGYAIPPTNRGIDSNRVKVDKAGYAIPPTNRGANVNRTDATVIPPTNRGIDSNRVKVDKAGYTIPPQQSFAEILKRSIEKAKGSADNDKSFDIDEASNTEKMAYSKGRDFDSNNRMSGKNSRSVVSDIGNVNVDGNNRMSDKNSRGVVSDMGNVNTSPKYRTITNADLETIRVEMREEANHIAKDITLTNDDLSDLSEPEASLEI